MPSQQKLDAVAEIKERLSGAQAMVLADYRGLDVGEMQVLRRSLRAAGCQIKIYKNRLTKIALADMGRPAMDEHLLGPTAFVLAESDPARLAKTLMDFAKEHSELEVKAGYFDGEIVDAATVKVLASLPSREELIAKFMGTALNPVRGFMAMANAPAGALARVMRTVADQKAAA